MFNSNGYFWYSCFSVFRIYFIKKNRIMINLIGIDKIIEQFKTKDYSFLLLCALCFFPIMQQAVVSISIILFATASIVLNYKRFPKRLEKLKIRPLFLVSGFYLLSVITLFYSENLTVSVREIQRGISLFIIPLCIFYFMPIITKEKEQLLFKMFTIANLVICSKYIFWILKLLSERGFDTFFNFNFRGKIFIHANIIPDPTYICLGFSFCIIYLGSVFFRTKDNLKKIISGVLIFNFLIFIFLLSARTVIFSILISLVFVFIFFVRKRLKLRRGLVFLLLFFGVVLLTIQSNSFKGRFLEEINLKNIKAPSDKNLTSLNVRYGIYSCGLKIIKDNSIFGVGIGDLQDELNKCYNTFDTQIYKLKKMNAHNQYLQYFIIGGILTLLLFLLFLFKSLQISFKNNDIIYFVFLIILMVTFTTESILARIYGIVYFSIFNSIFYYRNLLKKKL